MTPRHHCSWRAKHLAGLLFLLLAFNRVVAAPIDELLPLVPPDTGICLVIQNLREQSEKLSTSPFAAVLKKSPVAEVFFPSQQRAKLAEFDLLLRANLDTSLAEFRDDILGDAIVFAFRPAPVNHPDQEQGLLLIRPRNLDRLKKCLDKLNELQKASGELREVRTRSYRDSTYHIREKSDAVEYYLIREGLFAFTGQEQAMRSLIDQVHLSCRPDAPLSPIHEARQRLDLESAFVVCWFQPRVFDQFLKPEASEDARERAFLQQFRRLWQSCDSLAIYAEVRQNLEIGWVASFQAEPMPAELKPLILESPRFSRLSAAIPGDCLASLVGTIDLQGWYQALVSFLPSTDRDSLKQFLEGNLAPVIGRQWLPSLVQGIGPGWAVWVSPPPRASDSSLPVAVVAVEISSPDPKISVAIGQALEAAFHVLRICYNRTHHDQIDLHDHGAGIARIRFFRNDAVFPSGFQPAFAIKGNVVLMASHPDAIGKFQPPPTGTDETGSLPPPVTTLTLQVSAKPLMTVLEQQQELFAKVIAGWTSSEEAAVRRKLAEFRELLKLLKQLHWTTESDRRRIRWRLQIEFSQPLQP